MFTTVNGHLRYILLVGLVALLAGCTAGAADPDGEAEPEGTDTTSSESTASETTTGGGDEANDEEIGIDQGGQVVAGAEGDDAVVLQVITPDSSAPARATNFVPAAEALNAELEAEGDPTRVQVEAIVKPMGDEEYDQHLIFAHQSGNAADIYATGYTRIGWLAEAGYILPVPEVQEARVFADLIEGYWEPVTYDGEIWGVIQDTEARPMLYNQQVLRDLGWSQAEIDALPDRIQTGDFLVSDLTEVARQAVEAGITDHGFLHTSGGGTAKADLAVVYAAFGADYYDPESESFVLERPEMEAALTWIADMVDAGLTPPDLMSTSKNDLLAHLVNGRTLALTAGIWDEAKFRTRGLHDELGNVDDAWIAENIGTALMPAADPDLRPATFSNPWVYVVSSDTDHPEYARRLLEHVSAPELQARHGVESSHIPFTEAGQEQPEVEANQWLSRVSYLIEFSRFMPNDPDSPTYGDIVFAAVQNVETGAMTPEEAVEWMAGEMQRRLERVEIRG